MDFLPSLPVRGVRIAPAATLPITSRSDRNPPTDTPSNRPRVFVPDVYVIGVDRVRILHPEVLSVMAVLSLGGATVEALNAAEGVA